MYYVLPISFPSFLFVAGCSFLRDVLIALDTYLFLMVEYGTATVLLLSLLLVCSCFYVQDMAFLFGAVLADCLRFQVNAWISFFFLHERML